MAERKDYASLSKKQKFRRLNKPYENSLTCLHLFILFFIIYVKNQVLHYLFLQIH